MPHHGAVHTRQRTCRHRHFLTLLPWQHIKRSVFLDRQFRRATRFSAVGRSASGSYDNAPGKQPEKQPGGRGPALPPGEPLILTPGDPSYFNKRQRRALQPSVPHERTRYRRRKDTAEAGRKQRAENLADLDAASQRARVSFLPASPAPSAPRVVLLDGYNAINSCAEMKRLAAYSLKDARVALNRMAVSYAAACRNRVYVIYDAMGSRSDTNRLVRLGSGAFAIFSCLSEADTFISHAALYWKRKGSPQVMVVSNDRYVQDNAIDLDYVIFAVQLETWMEQASSAPSTSSGSVSRDDVGVLFTPPRVKPFRLSSPLRSADDGDGDGGGRTSTASASVLRSSEELQDDLVRLTSSSSSSYDDEAQDIWASVGDDEGEEEEEGEEEDGKEEEVWRAVRHDGIGAVGSHVPDGSGQGGVAPGQWVSEAAAPRQSLATAPSNSPEPLSRLNVPPQMHLEGTTRRARAVPTHATAAVLAEAGFNRKSDEADSLPDPGLPSSAAGVTAATTGGQEATRGSISNLPHQPMQPAAAPMQPVLPAAAAPGSEAPMALPKVGISDLLGKGGRARLAGLAGLAKRATQNLSS